MDVRDLEADAVLEELSRMPAETMLHLLLATAALIDVDRPVSELLAWADVRVGAAGWCSAGRHLMSGRNLAIQRNGKGNPPTRRCRACQRERRAAAVARGRQDVAS